MKLLDSTQLEAARPMREVVAVMDHGAQVVLRRAAHLARQDQMLVTLTVHSRLSQRRIAELMDLPHGTVARRLKRLGRLLHDPLIIRLLDGPCPMERVDRQLAIGRFLHRQSVRELAAQHDLTRQQVSRRVHFLKGWLKGASLRR